MSVESIELSDQGLFLDLTETTAMVGWKTDEDGTEKFREGKCITLPRDMLQALLDALLDLDLPPKTPTAAYMQAYEGTECFVHNDIAVISKSFKGQLSVGIRAMFKKFRGDWTPGRPGANFGYPEAMKLIKALQNLLK